MSCFVLTSESVSEGHPDKVAELISDYALDACLSQDPTSKVAVETLVKEDLVVLAGEVTTGAKNIDFDQIARQAVREIGYDQWLSIESFAPNLGDFSSAVCIWRDIEPNTDNIAFDGIKFLREKLL